MEDNNNNNLVVSKLSQDPSSLSSSAPPIPLGEIVGLQFGLVTSDDVNDWAVSELDKTNSKKNSIAPGSVTSQNLGALNNCLLCLTCGNNNIDCPGHDGKITLFQPICNVNFFPIIQKICSSLCYRCARVLIPDNQIKRCKNKALKPFQTTNYKTCVQDIFKQSEKYKTCWFPKDPNELAAAHKKKKKKQVQPKSKKVKKQQEQIPLGNQFAPSDDKNNTNKRKLDDGITGEAKTIKKSKNHPQEQHNNIPEIITTKKRKNVEQNKHSNDDESDDVDENPEDYGEKKRVNHRENQEIGQREDKNNDNNDFSYEQPHWLNAHEAKKRGYCGARQPDMWILDQGLILRPVFYIDKKEDFELLPVITPKAIERMLKYTNEDTHALFGFNALLSPLHAMMVSTLLVPSHNVRPLRTAHGTEDDLTKTLKLVQKFNLEAKTDIVPNLTKGLLRTPETKGLTPTAARKKMQHIQGPMSKIIKRKKISIVPECLDSYFLVQRAAACLWDSKYSVLNDREYYRTRYALKQRFAPSKRNKGRVRQMMLGKRINYCFRGVAVPNTDMEINEIGVPRKVMMHITIPEVVNDLNFNKMLQLVLNGQHVHPGCNLVERNGKHFLPSANFGGLQKGDIVHRHMQNGDPFVGNRQPSLHRFAIMGYHAVMNMLDVIESHMATTSVLNEDFDGDEKVGYVPQGMEERVEVATLMNVKNNLMKDGKLVIGFVQHAVLGAFKLTDERVSKIMLTKIDIENYITCGKNKECLKDFYQRWETFNGCGNVEISGREFMKLLLPSYDPINYKNGAVTKEILNDCMEDVIEGSQDMSFAALRIGFLTRILEAICCDQGVSLTLNDVMIDTPSAVQSAADVILEDVIRMSNYSSFSSSSTSSISSFSPPVSSVATLENTNDEQAEIDICFLADKYREKLGKHAIDELHSQQRSVGILDIVNSGAKGSNANIVQITRSVGQQFNEYNARYKESTAHYYRNVLAKHGFVKRSYINGLTASEYFYQLRATRTGLIATGCGTGDSGYLYRKIYKGTEDERVMGDNSVRNAQGHIILFYYGFDTTFLHSIPIRTVTMNIEEVIATYIIFETDNARSDPHCDQESVDEVMHLIDLREQVIDIDRKIHIHIPVRFGKKFYCQHHQNNNNNNNNNISSKTCQNQRVAFSTARNKVVNMWNRLVKYAKMPSSPAHKLMFFENMSTSKLFKHGVLKCPHIFHEYMEYVEHTFGSNVCPANDPCGMKASQDSTQPVTQSNLKRFHLTGQKTTIVNSVTRLREIVNLTENIEKPMMYVHLLPQYEDVFDPMTLVELRLAQVVTTYDDTMGFLSWTQHLKRFRQQELDEDNDDDDNDEAKKTDIKEEEVVKMKNRITELENTDPEHRVFLTLYLNQDTMSRRKLIPREIAAYVKRTEVLEMDLDNVVITSANVEESNWWITIFLLRDSVTLQKLQTKKKKIALSVEETKQVELMTPAMRKIFKAQKLKEQKPIPNSILSVLLQRALVYDKQLLAGIEGIQDFVEVKQQNVLISDETQNGKLLYKDKKCFLTLGSNLQAICKLREVDIKYTTSNSIHQVFRVFGIEAAQLTIERELLQAIQASDSSISYQHIRLIAATMCFFGVPASLTFAAMTSKETATWYKRATFERSFESFLGAGISAYTDHLRGVSEAVMVGAKISLGTGGDFDVHYKPPSKEQLELAKKNVPKPQRVVFEKPNLDSFFNEPTYDDDQPIIIDLDEIKKRDAEKKHIAYNPKNRRGLFAKKHTKKYIQVYDEKDVKDAFLLAPLKIPDCSSSVSISTSGKKRKLKNDNNVDDYQDHFGDSLLFIPSSPKKRKQTERQISYSNTKKKRLSALLEKQQQLAKREIDLTNFFPRLADKKKRQDKKNLSVSNV